MALQLRCKVHAPDAHIDETQSAVQQRGMPKCAASDEMQHLDEMWVRGACMCLPRGLGAGQRLCKRLQNFSVRLCHGTTCLVNLYLLCKDIALTATNFLRINSCLTSCWQQSMSVSLGCAGNGTSTQPYCCSSRPLLVKSSQTLQNLLRASVA